ncbi:universal stress protein [Natronorarus salvus]|uniref:universal stress protein n=1 Tax=Natronorarus salvus TaxID=3117733 RepID=UPI002F2614C6
MIRVWTNGYSSRSTDRIQLRSHSVEPSRNIPEAELTILHVLDSSGLSHGGVEGGAAEAGVSARIAIEVGQPSDVIVEYAEEEGIDHIVMGSHGRSGLSKIVVGSVAESVIRDSQASVTIAR